MRENRPAIILHYLVDGLSFVDLRTQGTIPAARVARHEKGCLGFSTVEMHKGKRVETPISFFGKPFTATQIKAAPSSVLSEPAKVRMLEDMKTARTTRVVHTRTGHWFPLRPSQQVLSPKNGSPLMAPKRSVQNTLAQELTPKRVRAAILGR